MQPHQDHKVCNGCGIDLDASMYSKRTYYSQVTREPYQRLRSKCRVCEAAATARWLDRDRENIKARKRASNAMHKGSIRHWVQNRISKYRRFTPGSDLTVDYMVRLFEEQKGLCYYTGTPLEFGSTAGERNCISVDKVDPAKGYVVGNIVFCTFLANHMKREMTEPEFYAMMERILRHRGVLPETGA